MEIQPGDDRDWPAAARVLPPRGGAARRALPRDGLVGEPAGDLLHLERFDDVAFLHVVEAVELDAAFEARLDLGGVVLEPLERGDLSLVDDDVVAQEPD